MAGILSQRSRDLHRICALPILVILAAASCGATTKRNPYPLKPDHKLLVGYFPQWGLYDPHPYTVKDLVQSGAAAMLDQLNYAQGFVTGGRCSIADPKADISYVFTAQTSVDGKADSARSKFRGNFHQLAELKHKYPRMKILISLEGKGSDFAADAQPQARAAFVKSCVDLFLKGRFGPHAVKPGLFDGIDLDWEYPRGEDSKNYVPLLQEFRREMDAYKHGLILSVALGPSPHMYGDADLAEVGKLANVVGLMTYDFNGPWDRKTGFIAPLSTNAPDQGSVERSVTAWKNAGIPQQKLLVGLPFYGYLWRDVADANHGLGQDGRPVHGDHPYREIQALIPPEPSSEAAQTSDKAYAATLTRQEAGSHAGPSAAQSADDPSGSATVYRDPQSEAPWLFDGSSFWTYDDPTSIRAKAFYVDSQALGGFMVWELSGDTKNALLLKAARQSLTAFSTVATTQESESGASAGGAE